ncbi:MAG: beta-lactamase family protein [Bacteroidales bacterium]|nr:beta-lactamase family protein [Bacteroidales bacterium]
MNIRSFIIAASAVALTACGQRPGPESALDALCSEYFPAGEPGAAVLVLRGDEVLFDRGYGVADMEKGALIDGDTFFNIASVSKQFTATAVLQLVDRGLLGLDDEVRTFFPEFTDPIWEGICVKHLLSHSSGIPDARTGYTREQRVLGDEVLATEYLKTLDHLNFAPGTDYEYINPTFVLLGYLVERVTGENFYSYVKEHIFLPAGMEETLYFDRDHQDLIPRMAHGYEYEDVTDMPEERIASETSSAPKNWYEYDFGEETFFATRPDGGIYTSTHEFVKWEKALRACYAGAEGAILSAESIGAAHSPHTTVSGSQFSDYQNRPDTWYGYGWFIEDAGEKIIYHTGDNGGFKILAARYPGTDTLVLVFANRADWDRYELMKRIEDILRNN